MSVAGATRVYVSQTIAPGTTLELAPGPAHHLRTVLRLGAGAAVAAFNASDGEWLCRIADIGRDRMALIAERLIRPPEPEPDLWLLFAPIKRAHLDWLVEKATELGVARCCRYGRGEPRASGSISTGCARTRSPPPSRANGCPCRELHEPQLLERCSPRGPPSGGSSSATRPARGAPIAEALGAPRAGAGGAFDRPRRAALPRRSLTHLGKLSFVTRSGSGPACCAPIRPHSRLWRCFRRSPATGAAPSCAMRGVLAAQPASPPFGAIFQGVPPRMTTTPSIARRADQRSAPAGRIPRFGIEAAGGLAGRDRARKIRLPPFRSAPRAL